MVWIFEHFCSQSNRQSTSTFIRQIQRNNSSPTEHRQNLIGIQQLEEVVEEGKGGDELLVRFNQEPHSKDDKGNEESEEELHVSEEELRQSEDLSREVIVDYEIEAQFDDDDGFLETIENLPDAAFQVVRSNVDLSGLSDCQSNSQAYSSENDFNNALQEILEGSDFSEAEPEFIDENERTNEFVNNSGDN